MKTTLSKSLLCGIIASTFLLANCQKAPTGRSVKAEVGKPGEANPADKVAVVDKEQNLVQCTPDFLKVYTEYYNLLKIVRADVEKKDEVTETRKADLLRFRKDLEEKVKPALDELSKLKSNVKTATGEAKKVDGCFIDSSKKQIVTIKMVDDDLNKLNLKITEITGEKSARSDAAIAAKKALEDEAKRKLQSNIYKVSAEMNELLDEPLSSTSKHFVDGRIAEKAELEANKKNLKASVCEVTMTSGKLESDKLTLKSLGDQPAKQENRKNIYSVALGQLANQGDKTYNISCSLPMDMKKEAGFEKAMGSHLALQAKSQVQTASDADEVVRTQSESFRASELEEAKKNEAAGKIEAEAAKKAEAEAALKLEAKAKADAITADAEKAKTEAEAKAKADQEARIAAEEEQSGT